MDGVESVLVGVGVFILVVVDDEEDRFVWSVYGEKQRLLMKMGDGGKR